MEESPAEARADQQNSSLGTKVEAAMEIKIGETAQSAFSGYEIGFSKLVLIYLG